MRIGSSILGFAVLAIFQSGAALSDTVASPVAVVGAERAFAADAQARGWIAAFKTYAAPDAVVFRPDPMNAQQSLADQPDEPADRSLSWWPVWAGMSVSGDLGFTTGPYAAGDAAFGHYFTVWAKQADGSWRWIFDGGPRNEARSPLGPETEPTLLPMATSSAASSEKAWTEVAAIEAALAIAAAQDAKAAYLAQLSNDARLMGSPAQPAVGAGAFSAELDRRGATIAFKPLGGRASKAGDLVFTYGNASWTRETDVRRGHYVRIWQRQSQGWKLVFDEILAVPPSKPKA
ncbi:MAG: DUF4440 domain-containing protein [Alphaproteobacteria bacterium]|nr:DUF4440 domain-containing protein [Alphaproteobacteria bacterium]